ncbi:nicotinamide riboside transporter PnuC [Acidicapsa ligni]|uniref:nicotinamide riboside transporter PnuC n=1 Tax=Acidicapsa ligni TaxID=542300 RepID=UPI0021DFF03B|nr:nicotinamide riboside transporter PnuC [Acidicapsa ligni]
MAPASHLILWLNEHWFELLAAVVSAVDVWLATRRSMISWPITIGASLLYGEQFRESKLYSDMLLQWIFVVFAIYGWWHWQRGLNREGAVRIETPKRMALLRDVALGAVASVLLGYWMKEHTDASLPWLDSTLTSYSLVGTWWGTQKYIVNWWLWIVLDLIYVAEYQYKHLSLTAVLYAVFVLLASLGVRDWRRAQMQQDAAKSAGVEVA